VQPIERLHRDEERYDQDDGNRDEPDRQPGAEFHFVRRAEPSSAMQLAGEVLPDHPPAVASSASVPSSRARSPLLNRSGS